MNRKIILLLGAFLLVSAATNVYLFREAQRWKTAWASQFVTTSEIEGILKASGADVSIAGIKKSAEIRLGANSVQTVDVGKIHAQLGSDSKGLKINRTLILFKNGVYHGSKADLPQH